MEDPLPDDLPMTAWQLPEASLQTVWKLSYKYWLVTAWWISENCLTFAWSMTAWQFMRLSNFIVDKKLTSCWRPMTVLLSVSNNQSWIFNNILANQIVFSKNNQTRLVNLVIIGQRNKYTVCWNSDSQFLDWFLDPVSKKNINEKINLHNFVSWL